MAENSAIEYGQRTRSTPGEAARKLPLAVRTATPIRLASEIQERWEFGVRTERGLLPVNHNGGCR